MQRLILHIGTDKTGTTSFQRTIREHWRKLVQVDGLREIKLQEGYPVKELMRSRSFDASLVQELKHFLMHKMGRQDGTFLVSCEYLSGDRATMYANSDVLAQMLQAATERYPTEICVLFRRQDEFIQSMYTQIVHRG